MTLQLVGCPLCGQRERFFDVNVPSKDAHIAKYGSLYEGRTCSEWKICGRCGFVHQNPRPTAQSLNEFYLAANYHDELVGETVERHLKFARWYYSEKIDYALRHTREQRGKVFDIGCGLGGVLKLFEERGWQSFGVEPDAHQARFAVEKLGLAGVRQGILDETFSMDERVDLVFSNHAFEHFADLDAVMKGVSRIIKPGGSMFIAIPTYMKNKSSLSRRWMNSAHYSMFTHSSLNNLLARYGFEEIAHTYSGWRKEHDDLWYVARYTGVNTDPVVHFEEPLRVRRYLELINPLRSAVFFPVYSHWEARVRAYTRLMNAFDLLMSSPSAFVRRVTGRAEPGRRPV